MTENDTFELMQGGRRISEQEIEQICETVELFPRLALNELVATICEHLGWYTAAGGLKENACYVEFDITSIMSNSELCRIQNLILSTTIN